MAGTKYTEQHILNMVFDETNAALRTGITFEGDIEIGAVEIKDSSGSTRATVGSDGLHVDLQANPLATAPLVGQATIAVTSTAVQLGDNALTNGVIIIAKSDNSAAITIGGSGVNDTIDGTGNGAILEAGMMASFAVDNTNRLYINGTAGDIVSFVGS